MRPEIEAVVAVVVALDATSLGVPEVVEAVVVVLVVVPQHHSTVASTVAANLKSELGCAPEMTIAA